MHSLTTLLAAAGVCVLTSTAMADSTSGSPSSKFRPPAIPLVTCDPYFSVWSMSDKLTDDWTKHWTGRTQAMSGMIMVDGKAYRFMGPEPSSVPAASQDSVSISPTNTSYQFSAGGVSLTVDFLTPLLPNDLDLISRPVSYIGLRVHSQAGEQKKHSVKLYLDFTGEWVVNAPDQEIEWKKSKSDGKHPLQVLRMGTKEQPILAKQGDDLRIDWGYLYVALDDAKTNSSTVDSDKVCRNTFAESGSIPQNVDSKMPRKANDNWPVMACTIDLGSVGQDEITKNITLAYDDIDSIEYMHTKLKGYWRRNGMSIDSLISTAVADYPKLVKKCRQFDEELTRDASSVGAGGSGYAYVVTTAYRQAFAAHKLVADTDGTPMLFSKENFSNGCIATVDISYPSCPLFLLTNSKLMEALLNPMMKYAASPAWPDRAAPHDLGTYPLANGQVYGGDQISPMPVEESGNMLIMLCALAEQEGNAKYAEKYWGTITKWAEYLKEKGLDPENQLCTDDFAGHLAHNSNLSIKAIVGLACYSKMAGMLGKNEVAADYRKLAEEMAAKWQTMAIDGDHYKLAFDQPGSWSQKYNLVWDKLLKLNLFDPSIAKTEITYYKTKLNTYGLPLDSREDYTKGDWILWTATLADKDEDFSALVLPMYRYLNETPSRVPFSDWHNTKIGNQVGFQARAVVGGVFIKMLAEKSICQKWNGKASK